MVLCAGVLALLAVEVIVPLPTSTRRIFEYCDTGVCILFIFDFVINLFSVFKTDPQLDKISRKLNKHPQWKKYFVRWGWLDLLSSIPVISVLRIGRVARIIRAFRLIRGGRATKNLAIYIVKRRARSTFIAATLVTSVIVVFSAVSVLHSELMVPKANIRTIHDALWWAIQTVATVGYGDKYPITTEGRLIGILLMSTGIGMFGIFAGLMANWFLTNSHHNENEKIHNRLNELNKKIDDLHETIRKQRSKEP